MDFLWMLAIGLVVGIIVKLLVPWRDRDGTATTLMLGIGGSLLVGYVGRGLGWYEGPFELRGIAGCIVGAMLVLFLYRLVVGRR